jgi:hypothetical protein
LNSQIRIIFCSEPVPLNASQPPRVVYNLPPSLPPSPLCVDDELDFKTTNNLQQQEQQTVTQSPALQPMNTKFKLLVLQPSNRMNIPPVLPVRTLRSSFHFVEQKKEALPTPAKRHRLSNDVDAGSSHMEEHRQGVVRGRPITSTTVDTRPNPMLLHAGLRLTHLATAIASSVSAVTGGGDVVRSLRCVVVAVSRALSARAHWAMRVVLVDSTATVEADVSDACCAQLLGGMTADRALVS